MSEFTPGGFQTMPALYFDNQRTGEFSDEDTWSDEIIADRVNEYTHFLHGDAMPRARQQAERILTHLAFEQMYRSGAFNQEQPE